MAIYKSVVKNHYKFITGTFCVITHGCPKIFVGLFLLIISNICTNLIDCMFDKISV